MGSKADGKGNISQGKASGAARKKHPIKAILAGEQIIAKKTQDVCILDCN